MTSNNFIIFYSKLKFKAAVEVHQKISVCNFLNLIIYYNYLQWKKKIKMVWIFISLKIGGILFCSVYFSVYCLPVCLSFLLVQVSVCPPKQMIFAVNRIKAGKFWKYVYIDLCSSVLCVYICINCILLHQIMFDFLTPSFREVI